MKVMRKAVAIMITLCGFTGWAEYAYAQNVARSGDHLITQLSSDYIDVSAGFAGASIDLFGDRSDPDTDVVVVVQGPKREATIWKKSRIMGAWVNRYFVSFGSVPIYYNYAVSNKNFIINNKDLSMEHNIGIESLFKDEKIDKSGSIEDISEFKAILIAEKKELGVFPEGPADLVFLSPHFFRASFKIPPSVPTGEYKIHAYLIKDGQIIDRAVQALSVAQVGINAYILRVAKENAFFYSVGCILFALMSGWFVSALRVRV